MSTDSPLSTYSTRVTPQSQPIPGENQARNAAGGFTYTLDDWARLDRFLILGVDTGTYYATKTAHAADNIDMVRRCVTADGQRAVARAVEISDAGRAPSNDPAIFVLAVAAAHGNRSTRDVALRAVPKVCRIGTHLFHFATYVQNMRGWGRGLRRGVARWYENSDADRIAYQAIKYRQRDGWTHRDLLRLSHPKAPTDRHRAVYDFICDRPPIIEHTPLVIGGYAALTESPSASVTAHVIRDCAQRGVALPWEATKSEHRTAPGVWAALVDTGALPLGAMIRNLGVMTARGVFADRQVLDTCVQRITSADEIRSARVHPIAILKALAQYRTGGSRGSTTWTPESSITNALDAAFYKAFGNVQSSGKGTLIGLDVSGSMGMQPLSGMPLSAREITTAMSLITVAADPDTTRVVGFTGQGHWTRRHESVLTPLDVNPRRRLDDIVNETARLPFGRTDCALPMLYATDQGLDVDTFVIYTDNETWAGSVHPSQALRQYRERSGIDARLIVCATTSTGFSIADPNDPGMLDVVGFDTATPQVISTFATGEVV